MKLSERQLIALSLILVLIASLLVVLSFTVHLPAPAVGEGYVALIEIEGVVSYASSPLSLFGSTARVDDIIELIDEALEDEYAKALVLCVNSPGGSAAASEALYLKVREFAYSKPVVVFIREFGTSGAYMASLPARKIVAANSSIVGSIGVYMMVVTYAGLLEKLGVKVYVFKSGELKDLGSPFRSLTETEKRVYEEMVREIFSLFKERVLMHRGEKLSDLDEVFSGRPFTATRALQLGLIDEIGTLDDAVRVARELAGLPDTAPVRRLSPPKPGLLQILLGELKSSRMLSPSYEILAMWPPPVTTSLPVSQGP